MNKIQTIQTVLGVKPDGIWGDKSQASLDALLKATDANGSKTSHASTFADPADLRAFTACKKTGKSDIQCFKVGDNGIGQFGANTAQEHTPMVAVHRDEMIARWGTVKGAAHKAVEVSINGKTVRATVEDRISALGRIDLNPAAAKALGLNPPFVMACKWRWL